MTTILRTLPPLDEFDHGIVGVANVTKYGVSYADSDATNIQTKATAAGVTLATGYMAGYTPGSGGAVVSTTVARVAGGAANGQTLSYSDSQDLWLPVNAGGGLEVAYATNGASATQPIAAGTSADVTNCAITLTNSNGRPVWILAGFTGIQTDTGGTNAQMQAFIEETTGTTTIVGGDERIAQLNASGQSPLAIFRAGIITTNRTFKLTATSLGAGFTVQNNATIAGWAAFIAALQF